MNLKLSFYTIISPIFFDQKDGYNKNIIYSSRTTDIIALHSDYITILQNSDWHLLPEDILEKLIDSKILVSKDEDELQSIITYNRKHIAEDQTLSFIVQPTAQCQLGCDYCGQEHVKKRLTANLEQKIIERFIELFDSTSFKKVFVSWFGAEPLIAMSQMQRLSKKFIEIAKNHNFDYSSRIVTNGLNLTLSNFEILVKELGVEFIEITLDGTAEFHDQRRFTKKGLPTFDRIFSNIIQIVNSKIYNDINFKLSIRCNVDERNYEGVSPLIKLLAENRLQDKISFYVAPVHSWGNDAHKLALEKSQFAEKEIEWIIQLKENGFNHPYLPKLKPIVCMAVKDNSELIDAFGNIYNCTEISYVPYYDDKNFVLDNLLNDKFEKNERKYSDFNELIESKKLPCSTCEMLPVCGGGCPKSWEEGNIACPSNKFNIEQKLLLYYAELRGGINKEVELVNA